MKGLGSYLSAYRKECFLAPLFKLLEAAFELAVPLVVASLIDRGISGGNTEHILKMGGLLIFFGAAGLFFSLTAQFFAAKAATGFSAALRRALFEKIQRMDFSELDRIGTDTLITRMSSDVLEIQNGVNMFLRLLLRSPFIVFGAMIMAFTVDVYSALFFCVLIPCLFLIVFAVMKVTRPGYRKIRGKLDTLTGKTRENLTGVRVIRAFHREEAEKEGFSSENGELVSLQKKTGSVAALMNPVTYVLVNIFTVALIYSGALRVDNGLISRGAVVALVNYMAQILIELIKLANLIILLTKALSSAERVGEILDIKIRNTSGKQEFPPEREGEPFIAFDNVSLTYEGSPDKALENISFKADKGASVGIIGGTGSGKSSLVNLIAGFYEATEGTVRINGVDIKEIDSFSLRERTGMVFQKTDLFMGSIRDNLKWGNPGASDDELTEALRVSEALDFVMDKPGGLGFMIEQGGRNLSGGQKQRLTIARAMVRKPEILILDDAASALDFATDARLRASIREIAEYLTIFIVSQRAASVRHADIILVMEDGAVAGIGSHEELLRSNEVYREIYYSQFPDEEKKQG